MEPESAALEAEALLTRPRQPCQPRTAGPVRTGEARGDWRAGWYRSGRGSIDVDGILHSLSPVNGSVMHTLFQSQKR